MTTPRETLDHRILSRLPSCECGCTAKVIGSEIGVDSNFVTRSLKRLMKDWPVCRGGKNEHWSYWMEYGVLSTQLRAKLAGIVDAEMCGDKT